MKLKMIYAAVLYLALSTVFAGTAKAACASNSMKGKFNASNLFSLQERIPDMPAAFAGWIGAAEVKPQEGDDSNASIVGLWAVTFFVGNTNSVWDQGFEQWHSDGTELNNDNAVPPSLGNVCVGVYKKTTGRTFKLRHVTWNFDTSGNLTGVFQLLATITVAPNGNAYTGTYFSDSFDLLGNVIPALHAEGILSATRITVD